VLFTLGLELDLLTLLGLQLNAALLIVDAVDLGLLVAKSRVRVAVIGDML